MKVIIYSTSTCAACEMLTRWLTAKGIQYQKKITDEDPAIMQEFMSVNEGRISVPFTVITDDTGTVTKISGFEKGAFEQVLGN